MWAKDGHTSEMDLFLQLCDKCEGATLHSENKCLRCEAFKEEGSNG